MCIYHVTAAENKIRTDLSDLLDKEGSAQTVHFAMQVR